MKENQYDKEARNEKLIREYHEILGTKLFEIAEGHKKAEKDFNELLKWIDINRDEYNALLKQTCYHVESIMIRTSTKDLEVLKYKDYLQKACEAGLLLGYYLGMNRGNDQGKTKEGK